MAMLDGWGPCPAVAHGQTRLMDLTSGKPDVSILVVTFRCRDEVAGCLATIPEACGRVTYEVVVVDNASRDGTVELIREQYPEVKLEALEENVGFAAGVNLASRSAHGEYLLLLNPDTAVHPGAIETLVSFARANPRHGLYGGRNIGQDGITQPGSCRGAPSLWSLVCFATLLSTARRGSRIFDPESLGAWERDTVREVDILTGCLLLIHAEAWRTLNGFDPRFFMYGEDVDLALRARRAGYRPVFTPDAVVTHEVGGSSDNRVDRFRLILQAKVTVMRKHWSQPRSAIGRALLLLGVGARASFAWTQRAVPTNGAGAATWRALWDERARWTGGFPPPPEDT